MDRVLLEFHGREMLTENNPGIKGLGVGALAWQAMLDKESPWFVKFFCLCVGIDLGVIDPYDFLAHDDKVLPLVFLNQLFLVVFEVFKLFLQHAC